MAADNFSRALALLLVHEGGKTDDAHDPGGRTNWGITHIDYDAYRRRKGLPSQDVFLITESERDEIYRNDYWDLVRGDDLPSGLDYVVFDGAVNSGITRSIKWLQRALPAPPVTGRIDDDLVTHTQHADIQTLISAACEARREFLQQLSTFRYFGRGWTRRVNDVEKTALAWFGAAEPAPAPSAPAPGKALRENANPAPTTAPADAILATSAVAIAATMSAKGTTIAVVAPAPAPTPVTTTCPCAVVVPASGSATATPTIPAPAQGPTSGSSQAVGTSPTAPGTAQSTTTPPPGPQAASGSTQAKPQNVPSHAGAPATSTTTSTGTTAAVAAKPASAPITISDPGYYGTLTLLGGALIAGLYLSWSVRKARTRRDDALGDTFTPTTPLRPPKPVVPEAMPSGPHSTKPGAAPVAAKENAVVPLVENAYARVLSWAWIAVTIVINVVALAELMQTSGFAENWHPPFSWLGDAYSVYAVKAFTLTSASVSQQFGVSLPHWLLPIFVLYVSTASAFVVASTGLMKRETTGEAFFAAVLHAGWIFLIPAFVMDAVRYHVVARFARQNTVLFFTYIALFVSAYVGARFINDDILPGFMAKYAPTITEPALPGMVPSRVEKPASVPAAKPQQPAAHS